MSDKTEKRMAENYEITQGIRIGDKEVVFGIDEKCELPYLCGFYTSNAIFGSYEECMAGDDYVEMVEMFADRIREQCRKVREEQAKVTVPRETITAEMCIPLSGSANLEGKVAAIKADVLRPEYRSAEHQLIYVTGGNGARGGARGSACYCISLYSGECGRWERYDIQGEVKPERLPGWAKERLVTIQRQESANMVPEQKRETEAR